MKILIKNGRVLDPNTNLDKQTDVCIAGGRILALEHVPDFTPDEVIDASHLWVLPGLVDLALRLNESSQETTTLSTEMRAALAGGITSMVLPPDTTPVLDEPILVEMLKRRTQLLQQAQVYPLGALTKSLQEQKITEMGKLHQAGCVAFSQADKALPDLAVLNNCMQYASSYQYSLWLRPLERSLSEGVAASGAFATRLGLQGVPTQAETIALHSIFELQRNADIHIHICRVSSAEGIELIRQAKASGLSVSADVSINQLHFIDIDIGYFNSDFRLDPPLRSDADRQAIRAGLLDGTIDAICSDHTAIADEYKNLPFAEAQAGAVGAELLLSAVHKWSQQAQVPVLQALRTITANPASVLRRGTPELAPIGQLSPGSLANLVLFDPSCHWSVNAQNLHSRSVHTPFYGYELPGRVQTTIVGGRILWQAQ
ncbi:dihydroorotase [Brackiella oedipodis]|uniref:dihydroorotase n=1 Tax=Brackiella oedipodis TaxID=124225 RepID=UPI00048C74F0|nr:dihydroorotase [Brackiella oedipodis]